MFSELGVQEQTSNENNKTTHEQTRALTKKQNHQKKSFRTEGYSG